MQPSGMGRNRVPVWSVSWDRWFFCLIMIRMSQQYYGHRALGLKDLRPSKRDTTFKTIFWPFPPFSLTFKIDFSQFLRVSKYLCCFVHFFLKLTYKARFAQVRAARGWTALSHRSCIDPTCQSHTLDPTPEVPFQRLSAAIRLLIKDKRIPRLAWKHSYKYP